MVKVVVFVFWLSSLTHLEKLFWGELAEVW